MNKRYRFNGKERDEETGLYYYGARYYAAWVARWTSADPLGIGADGPGVYNYTRGSPVTFTDPSGNTGIFSMENLTKAAETANASGSARVGINAALTSYSLKAEPAMQWRSDSPEVDLDGDFYSSGGDGGAFAGLSTAGGGFDSGETIYQQFSPETVEYLERSSGPAVEAFGTILAGIIVVGAVGGVAEAGLLGTVMGAFELGTMVTTTSHDDENSWATIPLLPAARATEEVLGAASKGFMHPPNADGAVRTLDEALEIAERAGIDLENFKITVVDNLPSNIGAQYHEIPAGGTDAAVIVTPGKMQTSDGKWVIRLNRNVLASDKDIVWVLAHETDEISSVEAAFVDNGGRMTKGQFRALAGDSGTAHTQASVYADKMVRKTFGE